MKKLTSLIIAAVAALGVIAAPLVPATVNASTPADDISKGIQAAGGSSSQASGDDFNKSLKRIVDVMLFLLGAIAVIMIIIGGIRYATSNGDASGTKAAKDTILYAVIGLVVAIMAYAIVNFVVSSFATVK